jgi:hypothetical protein
MSAPKTPKTAAPPTTPITIRGKVYLAKLCQLKHADLRFYADNPRVYSALHDGNGKTPTQEEIEEHLQTLEHVKELRREIKENGGLIEPLYVKESSLEVVEGNSRLAAYRLLAVENAVVWEKVLCAVMPSEVTDSAIASLLGQLHLKGKKDWRPYEQASYLHRRHRKEGVSIPTLQKEFNLGDKLIRHRIAVIDFMIKHSDNTVERWSHYDELLKSSAIKKARENHSEFEQVIVEKIKSGEMKAVEVRDKLKVVCGAKSENPIKQVISGGSLDEAYKAAKSIGGENAAVKKLRAFRTWAALNGTRAAMKMATENVKKEIRFELKEIRGKVASLLKAAGPT